MITKIRLRRGTTSEWASVDPILGEGEPGVDTIVHRMKIGDGTTPWSGLPFQTADSTQLDTLLTDVQSSADAAAAAAAAVQREQVNGVAGLDSSGLIYDARIPSTVRPISGGKPVGEGELVFRITDPPFNAPVDGTSNATTAWNTAQTAADNAGRAGYALGRAVVEVPWIPGGYTFTTPLNLISNITYRGDRGVTLRRGGATNSGLLHAEATTGVVLEGFTLDAAGLISSGTVIPGTGTKIRRCTFVDSGFQQSACYAVNPAAAGADNWEVSECTFANMRNNIHMRGTTNRVRIEKNDIYGWSSTAIAVDGDATTCSKTFEIVRNFIHDHNATTRAITSRKITGGNLATVTLSPDNPYQVGETIYVDVGDAIFDGNHTITAVSGNDLSWAKTTANSGPTATTGRIAYGNRQPVSVQGDDSELSFHEGYVIDGNIVIGNGVNHQNPVSGGTADNISVHHSRNYSITNNVSLYGGDTGIIGGSFRAQNGVITNNVCVGNSNPGIGVGSTTAVYVRDLTITGNICKNNGQNTYSASTSGWEKVGVNIRKMSGGLVENNTLADDQTTPVGVGTATFTDTGDLVTTPAAHGLTVGQSVMFSTITSTTGIVAYRAYYVLSVPTSTTFTLSAVPPPTGTLLPLTTNGTGAGLVVFTPTQQFGISIGDTVGSSDNVVFGPNAYRGNAQGRRLALPGNTDLIFNDRGYRRTKVADQAMDNTTNTTGTPAGTGFVNVTDLAESVEANAVYELDLFIPYTSGSSVSEDLQFQWAYPAGCTMAFAFDAMSTTQTASAGASTTQNRNLYSIASQFTAGGHTSAGAAVASIRKALLVTGTTAGILQLQFAQVVGSATVITVKSGAMLTLTRIA